MAQFIPKIYNNFYYKIIGYFWGVTSSGRGFLSRGASVVAGRGGLGRGRGSAPRMQTETRTQARVYAVTQQDVDAAPDVVTGIISILDHDAYTLVDPGAMHSFASRPFLDRF